jgi:hypothetical protein
VIWSLCWCDCCQQQQPTGGTQGQR